MRHLLILTTLLFSMKCAAQNSNLVFFSENGEKFTVVLNGIVRNAQPESNVKVAGITGAPYLVKIEMADTASGVISEKIEAVAGKERTYTIRLRTITETEKSIKKAGVDIERVIEQGDKNEAAAKKQNISETNSKYILKLFSESDIVKTPVTTAQQAVAQSECAYPLNDGTFAAALQKMETLESDEKRMVESKQLAGSSCLSVNQVRQLILMFSQEENRLELAKYAYPHTFDKQNYGKVSETLSFEASVKELENYIKTTTR